MTSMISDFKCFPLTSYFTPFSNVSSVDFEKVNVSWERYCPEFIILIELVMFTLKSQFVEDCKVV